MISIITPVYNGESFIESCLQVVINQNCPNLEHIIVDGGSTDNTVNIIKSYAENYPHIRWISEPDKGQSDAMNKGIAMAKAEIIAILNVDDFYEKNVLNRVLELFESLPEPSFLVGNCKVWDYNKQLKFINKPQKLKLTELLLGWTINPHPINPSAYFYHKSLHEKIGLYDIEQHYTMDVDFIYKAVQAANVQYINEIWGNYQDLEGTKTFNDRESGEGEKRLEALRKKYQQRLPPLVQLTITWQRYFLNKIWSRFQYFQRHPDEIWLSIQKKLHLLKSHP